MRIFEKIFCFRAMRNYIFSYSTRDSFLCKENTTNESNGKISLSRIMKYKQTYVAEYWNILLRENSSRENLEEMSYFFKFKDQNSWTHFLCFPNSNQYNFELRWMFNKCRLQLHFNFNCNCSIYSHLSSIKSV